MAKKSNKKKRELARAQKERAKLRKEGKLPPKPQTVNRKPPSTYGKIKKRLEPELKRLHELASKEGELDAAEESEVNELLGEIYNTSSDRLEIRNRQYNGGDLKKKSFNERLKMYENEFGHPNARHNPKAKTLGANCTTRAITAYEVLSDFPKRGFWIMSGHIAPAIEVKGKMRLMDESFVFENNKSCSPQEYCEELAKAHSRQSGELRNQAVALANERGEERPSADYFMKRMRYVEGDKEARARARADHANKYFREERFNAGLPHLKKAIEMNPRDADFHVNMAGMLLMMGREKEALEHHKKAKSLDPKNVLIDKAWRMNMIAKDVDPSQRGVSEVWEV